MKWMFIPLVFIAVSCNPFIYYPDTLVEERIEDVILEKTGIRMDLSGTTPDPS